MVCDKCKEREAVCEFAHGNRPAAGTWHLCELCLQQFAPGFPSLKHLEEKSASKKPPARGESSCGWISLPPGQLNGSHMP